MYNKKPKNTSVVHDVYVSRGCSRFFLLVVPRDVTLHRKKKRRSGIHSHLHLGWSLERGYGYAWGGWEAMLFVVVNYHHRIGISK